MFAAWVIGISIRATSNFGLIAANISRQAAGAGREVDVLNKKVTGIGSSTKLASNAMFGLGIAAAATFAIGIKGASELQNSTLQAAAATGRLGKSLEQTMSNMLDFKQVAFSMSKMTGQTISDSMGVVSRMASAGVPVGQLKSGYKQYAQFTDVLHFGKDKMSYEDAGTLGAVLSHDLRLYNKEDLGHGLGLIAQMGYLSPHSTQMVATQVRRMAPALMNVLPGSVQKRADTIIDLAAWSDRVGTLQFSGSAIGQMLTQMIAPRSKRVAQSLENLGIYDHGHMAGKKYIPGRNRFWDSKTQTFDLMGALHQAHSAVSAGRVSGDDSAVKALFGGTQNMQRMLMALTSKESLTAWNFLQAQHKAMGDPVKWMDTMQVQLMQALSQQTALLISNFKTLATLLAEGFIPPLTKIVGFFAKITGDWGQVLMDHPKRAGAIGAGVGALGLYGMARVMAMAGNFVHGFMMLGRHPHGGIGFGHMMGGGYGRAAGSLTRGAAMVDGFAGGVLGMIPFYRQIAIVTAKLWAGTGALRGFALILGRLGMRAIPVVGQIWMVIEALQFLGKHADQIGYYIGLAWHKATTWIATTGKDLLINAGKAAWGALVAIITNPNSIKEAIGAYLRGIDKSIDKGIGDLIGGVKRGASGYTGPARPGSFRDSAESLSTGKKVSAINVNIHAPYHAALGATDAQTARALGEHHRGLAQTVAREVAKVARTSMRAATGIQTNPLGMSNLEFNPSMG